MKKFLFMLVCTATLSAPVFAQQITYACQYIKTAGLNWEKGAWEATNFRLKKPFFLAVINKNLTLNSVDKVLGEYGKVFCHPPELSFMEYQTCTNQLGASLVFNHDTGLGGVAHIYGAVFERQSYRDSLTVAPFTCTKM